MGYKRFALTALVPLSAFAADLTVTAGAFRFPATDYYYPNFYEEAGVRGEVAFRVGSTNNHTFRLLVAAYPMDDNIFEPSVEYAWRPPLAWRSWDITLEPAAGLTYAKLQYPTPYYPTVEHHFLPFVRLGGDARIGHHLIGPLSFDAGYRGRFLLYVGSSDFLLNAENKVERFKFIHAPTAGFSYAASPKVTLLLRGGWEFGGYYDAVFLTPDFVDKSRPYAEVGATYKF